MNKLWVDILMTIALISVIIACGVMILNKQNTTLQSHFDYCMCCDNKPCTDTYYNLASEKCIIIPSGESYGATNKTSCHIDALM